MDSRLNAVVLLADPARSESLGACLSELNLHVITLREFGHFTAILNSERIDVLVLDHELGHNQSGMQLLLRLKSELLHPATVLLTNVAEKELKDKNLPVHRTLPPDSSIDDIVKAVRRVIEAPRLFQEPIPLVARQLVQNFEGVKPLPQLLVKLSSYLGNIEEGSPTELAADISVDPRITAEVLKLTNSTALGLRHKVTRVVDAVNILGIRRTISLILASGVINSQRLAVKKLPDALRLWYYRRSVMIASTASVFARTLAGVSPDSAYILGLLQEMGILVLAHAFENSYFRLLQRVREVGHLRLDFTEKQEFQTTHAEASAALLQKWELPPSMVQLVLMHHNPKGRTQSDAADQGFLQVMEVAEAFANLSDSKTPQRHRLLAKCFEDFGAENIDKCRASLVEAVQKTVESSRLFAVPVPASDDLDELVERLASDAAEFEESEILDDSEPQHTRRVLLVTGDVALAHELQEMLQPANWEGVVCSLPEDAASLAGGFEAVLWDLPVGDAENLALVQGLRNAGYRGAFLILSADRSRPTVLKCLEAGVNYYLLKPLESSLLLDKLAKLQPASAPFAASQ